jgi:DNA (cytosine-5)-methyltransferase 1
MGQISMFDGAKPFKIDKPIRLIELFAGYGSQALALKYLGVPFEHHRICEWAVKSIQAYKDLHFSSDNTDYSQGIDKHQVYDTLFRLGISANYNVPMAQEQIARLGETRARQIYNNIKATNNLVSVCNATADMLGITDTQRYCYIMTYSFPCQDLSSAGKGLGMGKGTGTRSGLLWEVERLLNECSELPQVLVMENVPEVIGSKNIVHFSNWLKYLESLGYKNKWQVLNATDFGIPQNRARCFMVSILGDYYYDMPKPMQTARLSDIMEYNTDYKLDLDKAPTLALKVVKKCVAYSKKHPQQNHSLYGIVYDKTDKFNGAILKDKARTLLTKAGGGYTDFQSYYYYSPKECFRLMGVKDEDFIKVAKNQSNSSLYHLAGDSIVTNVLQAIFKQMI